MKTEYKYIKFIQTTLANSWNCLNKKSDDELGSVSFYKPWNQFVFEPDEFGILFSTQVVCGIWLTFSIS